MPFEFAFLDWLQQFHNPVLDALAVFLNYAGEHGEIWIAFTLLLLLFVVFGAAMVWNEAKKKRRRHVAEADKYRIP